MNLISDPLRSGVLYSVAHDNMYDIVRYSRGGLTRTLQYIGLDVIFGLGIAPTSSTSLYASGISTIWKTIDSGDSWIPVWTAPEVGHATKNGYQVGVVVHPINPEIALVTTKNKNGWVVMKTIDGGASWTATALTGTQATEIVFDTTTPNIVYAATWGGGIKKSHDTGDTWVTTTVGLPSQIARSIVIDPNDSSRLYAVIGDSLFPGRDVYTSEDGGVKVPFLVPVRRGLLLGPGASPFSLVLSFWASRKRKNRSIGAQVISFQRRGQPPRIDKAAGH